jgi:hypothetical protein
MGGRRGTNPQLARHARALRHAAKKPWSALADGMAEPRRVARLRRPVVGVREAHTLSMVFARSEEALLTQPSAKYWFLDELIDIVNISVCSRIGYSLPVRHNND